MAEEFSNGFSAEEIFRTYDIKYNEEIKNMMHVNIIVSGKTGVGKSTLLNAVFGQCVAETGIGQPITKEIKKYEMSTTPLRIWDTVGLELSEEQQFRVKKDILDVINNGKASADEDKYIHCIWYCIDVNSSRIEETEIEFIDELAKDSGIPVILILTKAFNNKIANEFKSYIDNLNLHVKNSFCVLAQDYEINDEYVKKAYGLNTLVEFMASILPECAERAFTSAQCVSMELKRKHANAAIAAAVVATGVAGATPLPFADALAIVPIQLTMIAKITTSYGIQLSKAILSSTLTSLLGTSGVTILGKTIVATALKLIPGVGSVAGGAISAGTAAVLTVALGKAYMAIIEKIAKNELSIKELESKKGMEELQRIFKENMKNPNSYKEYL